MGLIGSIPDHCTASPDPQGNIPCRQGWLSVSSADFERAIVGQFYESAGK
jgi:hypothetical protein